MLKKLQKDDNTKALRTVLFSSLPDSYFVPHVTAVLQATAGQPCSEGQVAGDGAASQSKQSGAGATPTGLTGFQQRVCVCV